MIEPMRPLLILQSLNWRPWLLQSAGRKSTFSDPLTRELAHARESWTLMRCHDFESGEAKRAASVPEVEENDWHGVQG